MNRLIKQRTLATDTWRSLDGDLDHWLRPDAEGRLPAFPWTDDLLVPLALFRARGAALMGRPGRTGVRLEPADDPTALAADLGRLRLVAVNFPKLGDGRGFSTGRLLRERFGFRGELRAVGALLVDQFAALERCGFDAFELAPGQDADAALAAFRPFSEAYQGDVAQPAPLFRRRAA